MKPNEASTRNQTIIKKNQNQIFTADKKAEHRKRNQTHPVSQITTTQKRITKGSKKPLYLGGVNEDARSNSIWSWYQTLKDKMNWTIKGIILFRLL